MDPQLGSKVSQQQAAAWKASLAPRLYRGEEIAAVSKTSLIRPLADGLAVTSARVVGFLARDLKVGKIALEVFADDVAFVEVKKRLKGNSLVVRNKQGVDVSFGLLTYEDAAMMLERIDELKARGLSGGPEFGSFAENDSYQREAAWRTVRVVGNRPSAKAWQVVRDHASPGETPWFLVGGESGAGVLAAFEDRCLIVKVGAITSMDDRLIGWWTNNHFPLHGNHRNRVQRRNDDGRFGDFDTQLSRIGQQGLLARHQK